MRNIYKNIINTSTIIRVTIFMLLLFSFACKSDKKKGLIPEETFAKILYNVYLADGLFTIPEIRDKYYSRDSIANYEDVIESYGYSAEAMNRTLKYYFTEKPKKLVRIYDHAIGQLTEMELLMAEELDKAVSTEGGLWKGSQAYYITGRPDTSKLYFDHVFYAPGEYTLKYTITLYPSDQSVNPCFRAYTCRADSLATGRRDYFNGIKYIKDGLPHTYINLIRITSANPIIIRGNLIDFENNPPEVSRHVKIENISFLLSSPL